LSDLLTYDVSASSVGLRTIHFIFFVGLPLAIRFGPDGGLAEGSGFYDIKRRGAVFEVRELREDCRFSLEKGGPGRALKGGP